MPYPKTYDGIMYETYVDDMLSGTDGVDRTLRLQMNCIEHYLKEGLL